MAHEEEQASQQSWFTNAQSGAPEPATTTQSETQMSLDGGAGADDDVRRGLLFVSLDGTDQDMFRMPLRGSVVDVDTLDPDVGSHVGHTHHDVGHAKPAFPDPPPPVSLQGVPKPPKHPPCCSAPLRQGLVPGDSVNDWEYESQSYNVKKITPLVSKSKRLGLSH